MPFQEQEPEYNNDLLSLEDFAAARQASPIVQKLLPVITDEQCYQRAVMILDALLLEVKKSAELVPFLHILGTLISEYEQKNCPMPDIHPVEVLRFLMKEHGLTQSELPEIGNQAKVSDILGGKRQLNKQDIEALSKRFNLSPDIFFPKQ